MQRVAIMLYVVFMCRDVTGRWFRPGPWLSKRGSRSGVGQTRRAGEGITGKPNGIPLRHDALH